MLDCAGLAYIERAYQLKACRTWRSNAEPTVVHPEFNTSLISRKIRERSHDSHALRILRGSGIIIHICYSIT
jgi:hypothetical protein